MTDTLKQQIGSFLRRIAERLDPIPRATEEESNPFKKVATLTVEEVPKIHKEKLEVANLLRDGALRRLNARAAQIFIHEDSIRDEKAYWNLPDWQRRRYIDMAIAASLEEAS